MKDDRNNGLFIFFMKFSKFIRRKKRKSIIVKKSNRLKRIIVGVLSLSLIVSCVPMQSGMAMSLTQNETCNLDQNEIISSMLLLDTVM